MRYSLLLIFFCLALSSCFLSKKVKISVAEIDTDYGKMEIELYERTAKHKENFIKLANEKFYEGVLFHRVIKDFMIQTGGYKAETDEPGSKMKAHETEYSIEAEFDTAYIHKKGALAAARLGDAVNPTKKSSGSQFYIVQGKKYTDNELDMMESRMRVKLTPKQRFYYTTVGGTPFLDGSYTVYGEVISGFEVIDSIASVKTNRGDRPLTDVKVKSVKIKTRRVKR